MAARGGEIRGNVTAGEHISWALALGAAGPGAAMPAVPTVDPTTFTGSESEWLRPQRPTLASGGDIRGSLSAGGWIGTVRAFGILEGDVSAGLTLGLVWAADDITGDVSAEQGAVRVETWGELSGDVAGPEDVTAWAYEDLIGDITSEDGVARVGSWANVRGSVEGETSAIAFALDSFEAPELLPGEENEPRTMSQETIRAKGRVEVTAGGDVTSYYLISDEADVVIDAGGAVAVREATAAKNLWVAARGGSADGNFVAAAGWAYVWAFADVGGSIIAHETASVTAWNDLDANVTSNADWVKVFAGRNITGDLTGKFQVEAEARGDVTGKVTAGDEEAWAEAILRIGGNLTTPVTASGNAEVEVAGNVTGDIAAGDGYLKVTANGRVSGKLTATEEATVWAGGQVIGSITGGLDIEVRAGGHVEASVTSQEGRVWIRADGDLYRSVSAKENVFLELTGGLLGEITVTAGENVAILTNGDIEGVVEAEWVADVRTVRGEITADVKTRRKQEEWLTAEDSPGKQRLDVIEFELNRLNALQDPSVADQIQALQAERELHQLGEKETNWERIPANRVRAMIQDGVVKEYQGEPIQFPGYLTNWTYNTTGFVAVVDVAGDAAYFLLLEPFRDETDTVALSTGLVTWEEAQYPVSVVDHGGTAQYYKVAFRQEIFGNPDVGQGPPAPGEPLDLQKLRQYFLSDAVVRQKIDTVVTRKHGNNLEYAQGAIKFGMHLLPLVGAVDDFLDGNYTEAGISLAGDMLMLVGVGAAVKYSKCVKGGIDVLKLGVYASTAVDATVGAYRVGQGIYAAANGNTVGALASFGDATLRLLGVSATSIAWLRKRPTCFVAGTAVQTEVGSKAIEQVEPGERVWGFDRQAQQWRLCRVRRVFANLSAGRMATVRLSNGDELTGTDGHPVWVVEGEGLAQRGRPDHGADEPAGPTPGRWVPLGDLRVRDAVLCREGRVAAVTAVEVFAARVPVYNLEVEGLHSYAVGASGVLAHNNNDEICHKLAEEAAERLAKSAAPSAAESPAVPSVKPGAEPLPSKPAGTKPAEAPHAPPPAAARPESPKARRRLSGAELGEWVARKWDELVSDFGEDVLVAVTRGIDGNPVKMREALEQFETIVNNLKARDWSDIPFRLRFRRLETNEQIKDIFHRVFITNMDPKTGVLKNVNPQNLLSDLASISDLKGFQKAFRNLKNTTPSKAKGSLVEIQVAAADRRSGKVVEDVVPDFVALGKPTDIDVISDGTIWQIKVGDCPSGLDSAAEKLEFWVKQAVDVARRPGINKSKVGFRLDEAAKKWFYHPKIQAKLADLRGKYSGIDIIIHPDAVPTPPVP